MTAALDAHPEKGDAKAMVFLDSDSENRGGIQLHGWDDDADALAHLFFHLRALFRSKGKDLMFMPLPGRPEDQ